MSSTKRFIMVLSWLGPINGRDDILDAEDDKANGAPVFTARVGAFGDSQGTAREARCFFAPRP
jgi:hypothetical protein